MKTQAYAIPYRRYSSALQANGSSEARQGEGFETFLKYTPGISAAPAEYHYFDKGKSGYHGKHLEGDFGRLLKDCEGHKFPQGSIVWFEDMDRFGRMKQREVQRQWGIILDSGYRIHVASENKTFTSTTPEMELLGVIIKAIMAHEYSSKLAGRLTKAWEIKRERGGNNLKTGKKSAACPCWIKVSADGTHYELCTEDRACVRSVKADYEKGIEGTKGTPEKRDWRKLYSACMKAIEGKGQAEIAREVCVPQNGLTAHMRNRALVGEFQYYSRNKNEDGSFLPIGAPIENYYPAVLTLDEFRQLQDALDKRKKQKARRTKKVTCLFTGLMFNEKGETLGVKTTSRGLNYVQRYVGRRDECGIERNKKWSGGKTLRYELLESAILDCFLSLTEEHCYPKDSTVDQKELANLEARKSDLSDKIEKWELEALELSGNASNSKLIQSAQNKLVEVMKSIEEVKTRLVVVRGDNLTEAKKIITEIMKSVQGEELLRLRSVLRGVISRQVHRIVITVRDSRSCSISVQMVNQIAELIEVNGEVVERVTPTGRVGITVRE